MINMRELVKSNEQIMWEGKPNKATTVLEGIFNPMLIFALIWAALDITVIVGVLTGTGESGLLAFIIPFMMIHMMPVWIYLIGVLTVFFKWKNTYYMITTHGLYISGGVFAFNYEMKPWTDIGHIKIHQGVFDRMFGVGDVVFICNHSHSNSNSHSSGSMNIRNIPDFQQVFKIVNNLQTDVYADTMYPNAMRPDTNPGYNTQYTGMDR